ncbi:MAG: hypothetical protein KIS92_04650 [Planctomycetota bacterium]|nr:hypothetical protein [Planctomycetota bacterium]
MTRHQCILVVAVLATVLAVRAQAQDSRAEIIPFLAENIDAVLRAGEKPKAWLLIFGSRTEYPIVKCDEKAITVLVQGNAYPAPWNRIENPELIGIAKSVANGKGERLLVAAEVALALDQPEEANRLLALAREADASLDKKINSLAGEVARAEEEAAKKARAAQPVKAAKTTTKPDAPPAVSVPSSAASQPVTGNVLQVGPSRQFKTIASAVAKAGPGTTVVIDPGTYNECMKLTGQGTAAAPIRVLGVLGPNGERPLLDGNGLVLSGVRSTPRAIMQVEGSYITIENLEFKNARNGNNGAGVRFNSSTRATLRNCKVTYCDMGLQGGDKEAVTIERCEIAYNGTKDFDGYSHNFYMDGNGVILRFSYVHDSLFGQNFKSRAHYNELWYNYICDSEEGEICLVDSEHTAEPNSNTLLVGNVVVSKVRGGDRNATKYIDYGSDTGRKHDGTLYAFHNTFVAGTPRIGFIGLSAPDTKAVLLNNIFHGSNKIAWGKSTDVKGSNNAVDAGADVPGGLANPLKIALAFADAAGHNYKTASTLNLGAPAEQLVYADGTGKKLTAVVDRQPIFPQGDEARPKNGLPDCGAYEQ